MCLPLDLPIYDLQILCCLLILTRFSGERRRYFSAAEENFAVVAT